MDITDIIIIYSYVVADHVDLIFVFVSGSDKLWVHLARNYES